MSCSRKKEDLSHLEKEISTLKSGMHIKDSIKDDLKKKIETSEIAFKLKSEQCDVIKS